MVNRFSAVFSNVPGPKKPLHFCGIKSQELGGLIPSGADLTQGFGALTHNDTLRLTFQAGTSNCKSAREVMNFVESNMEKVMAMKK
mmetsp:Transcript_113013/g.155991  ORF Transcript_113013/g.155991 Transcript_113013/m.155991 type:complete len:86 (-) Transcript_113013:18-275(-)|eukprot:CAMPEP_0176339056 /NCGR_PEP_ID=MMETSP0126-20121128/459_1 /TAXON_ID=141414 ORGANISM="Strombidinopsis acuminatum, Strain SPMC142" /NCGR_SAMPLE_ID=MMETSP0126 /ASSEMBLY_ACC=CAM_ASM_000229 /LENGTH=85 /DNA_ID=CAMNT_0017682417 /DNA_START=958 /DNA_END=1215 /DNA_ORIENTATION=+